MAWTSLSLDPAAGLRILSFEQQGHDIVRRVGFVLGQEALASGDDPSHRLFEELIRGAAVSLLQRGTHSGKSRRSKGSSRPMVKK